MVNISKLSEYSQITDSIVFSSEQIENGLIVQVKFPEIVPASDKVQVLNYLKKYAAFIRKKYPSWSLTFSMDGDKYCLTIMRTRNMMERLNSIQNMSRWDSYGFV